MPDVYDEELDNTSGPLLGESNDTTRSSPSVTKVKLTGYRLLNMAVIFTFGMVKAVLTYLGQSAAPTTIDWVAGVVLTLAISWSKQS
ncbi:hypothetical protein QCA50_008521 [Cerrena zonata]|uniref:Uncharacterized protein n=1 Tax=Cerrena zonata TaxID=2478898 RepID=A0AAW0G5R6_9APHY